MTGMNDNIDAMAAFDRALLETAARLMTGAAPPPARELHVYVGPADAAGLERAVRTVGAGRILFYVFPPKSGFPGELANAENCLFLPLSGRDAVFGKMFLAAEVLRISKAHFIFDHSLGESLAVELGPLRESVDTVLSGCAHARSSRLINLRASIFNLPLVCGSGRAGIPQSGRGVPAIVCGGGPSLHGQLETLRQRGGDFVIIASGRVGGVLLSRGVEPDVMAQVDPETDFDCKKIDPGGAALFAVTHSSPASARAFEKVVFGFGECVYMNRVLLANGVRLPGAKMSMTSLVTALDLAVRLGCPEIAMVGCEHCLSESGETHVREYCDDSVWEASTLEADGVGGGRVKTTPQLKGLHGAVERYLKSAGEGVRFYNCAPRGLAFSNTVEMSLEEFCARRPAGAGKPGVFNDAPRAADDFSLAAGILEALARYKGALDGLLELLRRHLLDGGEGPGVPMLRDAERAFHSDSMAGPFVAAAHDFAEDVLAETPESCFDMPGVADRAFRQEVLRLGLVAGAVGDMTKDLRDVVSGRPAWRNYGQLRFDSFRRFAVEKARGRNPAFADALERRAFDGGPFDFDLSFSWQNLPYARLRRPSGELVPMSPPLLEMEKNARRILGAFLKAGGASSGGTAVVFPGPGNWVYAVEYARMRPDAPLIVADPFPGLFSRMIEVAMFAHVFGRDSFLVAADDRAGDWRGVLSGALAELRGRGLEIRVFESPETRGLPETVFVMAELSKLL